MAVASIATPPAYRRGCRPTAPARLLSSFILLHLLPATSSALHVAFIIPPGSPMAMMMPLIHGCTDAGHNVTVLAYDAYVAKVRPMCPQADYVALGPVQRPEMTEHTSAIWWGMPYDLQPVFASTIFMVGLEVIMGWPLNRAAFPEIERLRPDVIVGQNQFGSFYSMGEALGVPAVGVAFGPQVWLAALEPPWSTDPTIGSIHTREEVADSVRLTVLNSFARWFGFGVRLVGAGLHNYRRLLMGLTTLQADSFEPMFEHPNIIPTLPELSGGYPALTTAYSAMVGMYDHPALEGASLGKSAQHGEIMQWLDQQQEHGNDVLYVAFGSEIIIDKHRRELLIAAFTTLKLHVLWAMKKPPQDLEVPPHVKVTPWAPQKAVLAHRAVKAFFSHGGANSVRESLASGTPIMVMLVMPDSGMNAVLHEKLGVAMRLSKNNISAESIGSAFRYLRSEPVQARARSVKELNDERADLRRAVEVIENAALRRFPSELPKARGISPAALAWGTFLSLAVLAARCWVACCRRCSQRCGGGRGAGKKSKGD